MHWGCAAAGLSSEGPVAMLCGQQSWRQHMQFLWWVQLGGLGGALPPSLLLAGMNACAQCALGRCPVAHGNTPASI